MSAAFLAQFIASLIAVGLLVLLARRIGRPRPIGLLDEARARALFAEEFPDARLEGIYIAKDAKSALARSGEDALLIYQCADGWVARAAPWASVAGADKTAAAAIISLSDAATPKVRVAPWGSRSLAAYGAFHLKLDPVTLATPVFILAVILELVLARLGRAKAAYEWRDAGASLLMGLGSTLAGALTAGLVAGATLFVHQHRLFTLSMTSVPAWAALFVLEDLCYYWFHRVSHERRIWWASHVNHHSSQHYNLTTALRQTWTGGLALTWVVWLPLAFLGFPPAMIAIEKGISLVYQFWIHTEAIKRLPAPIEAVFNTPSHHRVHHGRNPRYLDRNYAGILIIWDRLFGTFEAEDEAEPCRYGIVKNLGDFNLLRIAFHEWAALLQDVARDPRHALGYLFGPPGWSPDGAHRTSKEIRAAWAERRGAGAPQVSFNPGREKPVADGEPALSRR